jgi:dTDP-4-dehydrorhamnose 3,5-epimerase
MKLTPLEIEGAWLAESPVWPDERGYFREWFKADEIRRVTGIDFSVAQANISKSNMGVLRGIHYSIAPGGQAKWITCVSGHILDFIVDIRPQSSTYKKYVSVDLKGGEGRAVLVGQGLGHAFMSLVDDSTVSYLLSSPYSPDEELAINPMDPELVIDWQLGLIGGMGAISSPKDAGAPTLAERLEQGKLPRRG